MDEYLRFHPRRHPRARRRLPHHQGQPGSARTTWQGCRGRHRQLLRIRPCRIHSENGRGVPTARWARDEEFTEGADPCFGGFSVVSTSSYTEQGTSAKRDDPRCPRHHRPALGRRKISAALRAGAGRRLCRRSHRAQLIDCNDAFVHMLGYSKRGRTAGAESGFGNLRRSQPARSFPPRDRGSQLRSQFRSHAAPQRWHAAAGCRKQLCHARCHRQHRALSGIRSRHDRKAPRRRRDAAPQPRTECAQRDGRGGGAIVRPGRNPQPDSAAGGHAVRSRERNGLSLRHRQLRHIAVAPHGGRAAATK